MYEPQVIAALVTGVVSIVLALVSFMLTSYKLQSEQARWEHDSQRQREQWKDQRAQWEQDFQQQSE